MPAKPDLGSSALRGIEHKPLATDDHRAFSNGLRRHGVISRRTIPATACEITADHRLSRDQTSCDVHGEGPIDLADEIAEMKADDLLKVVVAVHPEECMIRRDEPAREVTPEIARLRIVHHRAEPLLAGTQRRRKLPLPQRQRDLVRRPFEEGDEFTRKTTGPMVIELQQAKRFPAVVQRNQRHGPIALRRTSAPHPRRQLPGFSPRHKRTVILRPKTPVLREPLRRRAPPPAQHMAAETIQRNLAARLTDRHALGITRTQLALRLHELGRKPPRLAVREIQPVLESDSYGVATRPCPKEIREL